MTRTLTPSELEDMTVERVKVGAVGRNAYVCQCGHIDCFPNDEVFRGCIIHVQSCMECEDSDDTHPAHD